jgi:SAM-dependent methyltransferase
MQCRLCGNSQQNKVYIVREMMFGLREQFSYFQCAQCDCLQIAAIPPDMTRYYPDNYISFSADSAQQSNYGGIPVWCNTMGIAGDILDAMLNGQVQAAPAPPNDGDLTRYLTEQAIAYYLPELRTARDSRVLDVGSGTGAFLRDLHAAGLPNVMGVDLFIERDIQHPTGVRVVKGTIHDLEPAWDVIMFHHAFEHVPDPLETLQSVSRLLAPEGVCLIRIPIVSYAWERYREHWVQLDAPRHFFLHSVKSIGLLAEKAGLRLEHVRYDSTILQFVGSEQYIMDIPLYSEESIAVTGVFNSRFSLEELRAFAGQTKRLNRQGRGDQAAFYLVKV